MRTLLVAGWAVWVAVGPAALRPERGSTAALRFVDVAEAAGVTYRSRPPLFDRRLQHIAKLWTTFVAGAAVGDFDGDGLDDILFASSRAGYASALYRNTGGFTFTDVFRQSGLPDLSDRRNAAVGAIWFDYDNDGRADLFVYRLGHNLLFHNAGHGRFVDVTSASGVGSKHQNPMAAIVFDYDGDGFLDILVGGFFEDAVDLFQLDSTLILPESGQAARNGGTLALYRNNGDGSFAEVSRAAGLHDTGFTAALGHGDYDDDGWQDVYVANDFGPDRLFHNNGDGTFADVTAEAIGVDTRKGMNVDFGDFNNDGRLDIYVTNITEPWMRECNMLWLNTARGSFVDVSQETGTCDTGWGWGAKFFDGDSDGRLDLYVANGFISAGRERYERDVARFSRRLEEDEADVRDARIWPAIGAKSFAGYERKRLFHNRDGVFFTDVAAHAGVDDLRDARGVAIADFNGDGAVDLLVTHVDDCPSLYRNDTPQRAWLELDLTGGPANRDAIGARVTASLGSRTVIREVNGGNGYGAQSSRRVHLGLGSVRQVDELTVRWPGGRRQVLRGVEANQRIAISESPSQADRRQAEDVHHGR